MKGACERQAWLHGPGGGRHRAPLSLGLSGALALIEGDAGCRLGSVTAGPPGRPHAPPSWGLALPHGVELPWGALGGLGLGPALGTARGALPWGRPLRR